MSAPACRRSWASVGSGCSDAQVCPSGTVRSRLKLTDDCLTVNDAISIIAVTCRHRSVDCRQTKAKTLVERGAWRDGRCYRQVKPVARTRSAYFSDDSRMSWADVMTSRCDGVGGLNVSSETMRWLGSFDHPGVNVIKRMLSNVQTELIMHMTSFETLLTQKHVTVWHCFHCLF
jgi:hypothetical protein